MIALLHTRGQPSVVPTAKLASTSQTSGGSMILSADKLRVSVQALAMQLGFMAQTKSQARASAMPSLVRLAASRQLSTCRKTNKLTLGSKRTSTARQDSMYSHGMPTQSRLKCTRHLRQLQKAAIGASLAWTLARSASMARLPGLSMFSNATPSNLTG